MVLFFIFWQLHLDDNVEATINEPAEVDFFTEHDNFDELKPTAVIQQKPVTINNDFNNVKIEAKAQVIPNTLASTLGPTVQLSESVPALQSERKSTIGGRKVQSKRPGVSYN